MGENTKIDSGNKDSHDYQKELDEILEHPLIKGDGVHICSDGTEVNWKTTGRNIRIRMMHLEAEEVDEVIEINNQYRTLMGRKNVCTRKVGGKALFQKNTHWEKAMQRSQEILDLFGKMYSGQEVHKIITTEWKLHNVKYDMVLKYQRENLDTINTLRDNYQKETSNVRLVHKRSRLDELTELYQSRKLRYQDTQTKSDYELMLKTLEQIRKEVEGQVMTINGHIQVEHELAIQEHVNTEIMKYVNINDLVIGRLCSKLSVNPKYILYRLHTSYYKKFTGFLPSEMDKQEEISYPSQIVYDFDRIAELNKSLAIEDVEYQEEVEVKEPAKANKLKELLAKKLEEKKQNLQSQTINTKNTDGK